MMSTNATRKVGDKHVVVAAPGHLGRPTSNNKLPPNTQQRREVLTEEEYSQSLSTVIRRNFFPDLPQLEAEVALQSAREEGDLGKVIALRRAARKLLQHEEEAVLQEEHEEQEQTELGLRKRPRLLEHESLTNFHLRVTSEDNAEYESIQKEELQKQRDERLRNTRQAMALLTSGGRSTSRTGNSGGNMNNNNRAQNGTPLILASDEFNPSPHRRVLTRQETERASQTDNPLFFVPTNNNETPHLAQNNNMSTYLNDKNNNNNSHLLEWKGGSDGYDNQAQLREAGNKNNLTSNTADKSELALLMPPPASKQSRKQFTSSSSDPSFTMIAGPSHPITLNNSNNSNVLGLPAPPIQYIPKDHLQKRIVPSATRFESVRLGSSALSISSVVAAGTTRPSLQDRLFSDAASTTDYTTDSTETDLDATPRHSVQRELEHARKRHRREQTTVVAMTPVIIPGQQQLSSNSGGDSDDEVDAPIMTWGNVSSTPLVLPRGQGYVVAHPQQQFSGEEGENATSAGCPMFNVAEETVRETAANQALAILQARGRRAAAASTPARKPVCVISSSSGRASRRLAAISSSYNRARSSSITPARSSSALGTALRASYSRPSSSSRSCSSASNSTSLRRSAIRSKSTTRNLQEHRTAHAATPQLLSTNIHISNTT
ncbi:hypothetical protein ACA910_000516 [Epithemia clementina (nom. ined.)]